jgi:hypothetical protein
VIDLNFCFNASGTTYRLTHSLVSLSKELLRKPTQQILLGSKQSVFSPFEFSSRM